MLRSGIVSEWKNNTFLYNCTTYATPVFTHRLHHRLCPSMLSAYNEWYFNIIVQLDKYCVTEWKFRKYLWEFGSWLSISFIYDSSYNQDDYGTKHWCGEQSIVIFIFHNNSIEINWELVIAQRFGMDWNLERNIFLFYGVLDIFYPNIWILKQWAVNNLR